MDPQLRGHLATSIRIGMSPADVAEALVHLVPYVGLPRVMSALRLLPGRGEAVDAPAGDDGSA
ncbi:hypothetical protein BC477_10725 [Clavibacter michiganensis subsp. michiganensis]|uniref:Carboxymuconolactone decarboxylase-like domain-containing protein n=1 Tax=Clavibacter michiganensis subsp. michiganensis TaxID=33013 RepID=A0A251XP78_CLAMM|nr:hypothetical protein BC477_10725 [Clavibacter michiganensis subsp. michiganensis]OUE05200.1 hypothetical protein CMMCAS07_09645 [Clavibacter michiganensis subsp. michiganensis]